MTLEEKVDYLCRLLLSEGEEMEQQPEVIREGEALRADAEEVIRRILLEMGAPDHLIGHPMVIRAIDLALSDWVYINNITAGLYPRLAEEFNTSAARVERAIRHLIEVTFLRCDCETVVKYFGNTISPARGKPTNGEFVARMANVVRAELLTCA